MNPLTKLLFNRSGIHAITALLLTAGQLAAQGDLTPPPGPPAPTMKSLDQVEARTPIDSAPFTIADSGSYYLTKPLTVADGDGITIDADNVTLDLNGFMISSSSTTGSAIQASNHWNITVKNGFTQKFSAGIRLDSCKAVRVDGLTIRGAGGDGILVLASSSFSETISISRCLVAFASNRGIRLGSSNSQTLRDVCLKDCQVSDTNGFGIAITPMDEGTIEAVTLDSCTFARNITTGLYLSCSQESQLRDIVVRDCMVSRNRNQGIVIAASLNGPIEGITIEDCAINGNKTGGISVAAGQDTVSACRITGCNLANNGDDGIHVYGEEARGFYIEGNTLTKTDVSGTGITLTQSLYANYVFRNVCMNYLKGYDLGLGVTRGPIVTSFGNLSTVGAAAHPMANFAR